MSVHDLGAMPEFDPKRSVASLIALSEGGVPGADMLPAIAKGDPVLAADSRPSKAVPLYRTFVPSTRDLGAFSTALDLGTGHE